jgi:hypothetical protein
MPATRAFLLAAFLLAALLERLTIKHRLRFEQSGSGGRTAKNALDAYANALSPPDPTMLAYILQLQPFGWIQGRRIFFHTLRRF